MTPRTPAETCADNSRRFIAEAHYELEKKGDRLQASEKASGAVAQAVKAIGYDREWRHNSHQLRREIVDLLAAEYGRPEWQALQGTADQLHDNFYEGRLHDYQVADRLAKVTDLLPALLAVRDLAPNADFVPTPGQQRAIARLRLTEEEAAAIPLIDFPPPMPPFNPDED